MFILPTARFLTFSQPNIRGKQHALSLARLVTPVITLSVLLVLPAISQAECPNEQLRQNTRVSNIDPATQQPYDLTLPNCRADEQVSPTNKDGGSGGVLNFDYTHQAGPRAVPRRPMQALADGTAVTYTGELFYNIPSKNVAFEEFEQYTSRRSSSVWSTVNGDTLSTETAPVPALPSAAETSPQFVGDAEVVEETPDGSKVFFLDDANTAPGEPDLYEYTRPSPTLPQGNLVDLTVDQNAGQHANVQGIIGTGGEGTETGSYVYFIAGGTLAPGAHTGGCNRINDEAIGEGCNLYLRHNETITFIATLAPKDERGLESQEMSVAAIDGVEFDVDWSLLPFERTAEVSPNGHYVVFGSHVALTAAPNGSTEIYRYDAETAETVCVSCSPNGAVVPEAILPSSPRALINGANRQRNTFNDGRVFFTTAAKLVSQDINNQADVYEWQAEAPHLISGGTSEIDRSVFTDASTNGSDVFFTTSQPLIPQDQDEINDIYDSRENGEPPPLPSPVCPTNTPCPATPPTLEGTPASATFTGAESPPTIATIPHAPVELKPLTRAQKLANALKACHTKRNKKKRSQCETTAHNHYKTNPHTHKPTKHHHK